MELTALIQLVITNNTNNSACGKIVAGDGALRKDVVIVPSTLPPGECHHVQCTQYQP